MQFRYALYSCAANTPTTYRAGTSNVYFFGDYCAIGAQISEFFTSVFYRRGEEQTLVANLNQFFTKNSSTRHVFFTIDRFNDACLETEALAILCQENLYRTASSLFSILF